MCAYLTIQAIWITRSINYRGWTVDLSFINAFKLLCTRIKSFKYLILLLITWLVLHIIENISSSSWHCFLHHNISEKCAYSFLKSSLAKRLYKLMAYIIFICSKCHFCNLPRTSCFKANILCFLLTRGRQFNFKDKQHNNFRPCKLRMANLFNRSVHCRSVWFVTNTKKENLVWYWNITIVYQ